MSYDAEIYAVTKVTLFPTSFRFLSLSQPGLYLEKALPPASFRIKNLSAPAGIQASTGAALSGGANLSENRPTKRAGAAGGRLRASGPACYIAALQHEILEVWGMLQQLLLSKRLFLEACHYIERADPVSCGIAISMFQDAVELYVWTVVWRQLDLPVNDN